VLYIGAVIAHEDNYQRLPVAEIFQGDTMAIDIRECKIGSTCSQWEHSAGSSNHGIVFSFRVATVSDRFAMVV